MSKTREIQDKKSNARLYPIYKMISWDLLFYYPIIYLFLIQVKNFSASQVLLADAFFTASCFVMQIPLGLLIDKFGKKNSVVFANLCLCIFNLVLMITNTYIQLFMAFFVFAVGYVIKGICETNILYDSLPRGEKRGKLYSKIDGIGTSRYYVVDAVTSIIAGFAFVINPYLPLILCLIGNIISTILSTRFKHTQATNNEDEIKESSKEYFRELKGALKFSFKSKRMLSLLIFFGLLSGLYYNWGTVRNGVLTQVELPEQYFGLVYAAIQVIAAICSRMQNVIHKKFRNKTLSVLGISTAIVIIIIGVLGTTNIGNIRIAIILTLFVLLGGIKGAFNVLIFRYLNNFTNRQIRIKLAIVRNIIYNVFTIIISLFGAWILSFTTPSNSIIILGVISIIALILLLHYMKDKVGLKPEKYSKEDLKYSQFAKFYKM